MTAAPQSLLSLRATVLAAVAAAFSATALAAQSSHAPDSAHAAHQVSATVSDFSWLVGRWTGRLANASAVAEVNFMPPEAGVLTGVMRLVDNGKVLVIELISLQDTPRGVEMRFRHFGTDLTALEPTFKQTMRLTARQPNRDTFENAVPYDKTLMSTQPRVSSWERVSADEFIAHSDIIDDDGKPATIEVRYRRATVPS
jgi:hypothetical protein